MSWSAWKAKPKYEPKKPIDKASKKAKEKSQPGPGDDKANRPKPIPPPVGKVEAYFNHMTGSYYAKVADGSYERTTERIMSYDLRANGYFRDEFHDNSLSWLEAEMRRISKEQSVKFAGEVAGFDPGVYKMGTNKVLVTQGPEWIEPVEGRWPVLHDFLEQLLGKQMKYFLGWIKWALDSLNRGTPWSPGQMLAIAGPSNAGKSFLQSLITPMLGGRVSDPYLCMIGECRFNDDIWGAEHALIGDKNHATDIRSRRAFGSAMKDFVANKEKRIEGKGGRAATLWPFSRLTLTLNDNPEALLVLPPLDKDTREKMILLHASQVKFPWPSKAYPDSQHYYAKLVSELPAFLWHLRRWRIPATIACQRYGVVSWLNPGLVEEVEKLSPENKLWEAIEVYLFADSFRTEWSGTSSELEKELKSVMGAASLAQILPYWSACGTYLGRLEHSLPDSIFGFSPGKNKKVYSIVRPGMRHGVDCNYQCDCRTRANLHTKSNQ